MTWANYIRFMALGSHLLNRSLYFDIKKGPAATCTSFLPPTTERDATSE